MSHSTLFAVALAFGVAGAVKGLSGMGLPTVAITLLSLMMSPIAAASLLVLPSLATNLVQCVGRFAAALAKRLWPLWAGVLIGVLFSPLPSLGASGGAVKLMLGSVLIAYGLWGLAGPALPRPGRLEPLISAAVGYVTGVITAATGVFVLPLTPYLNALDLEREELIQALGLSFTVCTISLMFGIGGARVASAALSLEGALALLAAFGGMYAGSAVRARLNRKTFQRVLFAAFVTVGAGMILKELT